MNLYSLLPPGRQRGLAYFNGLQSRRNRQPQVSPIRHFLRVSHINTYEVLSQLQDVKVGVNFKNLLKKSSVSINKEQYFCVICQDDIEKNDIIRTVKCAHSFHLNCIDTWLSENKKCPTCKYEI